MMTGPELQALAAKRNENPYYLAYALATGAKSCREAFERDRGNHEYVIWNNARWGEQSIAEKIHRDWVSIQDGAVDRHIALCATFIPIFCEADDAKTS